LIHDKPDDPKTQLYATAGCIEICGGPEGLVAFNQFLVRSTALVLTMLAGCPSLAFSRMAASSPEDVATPSAASARLSGGDSNATARLSRIMLLIATTCNHDADKVKTFISR
jgi:hypothetical protein